MASSKFLTLGGLGASATAAVAGPGATLSGGPSLAPAYSSTLFNGLKENSNSLFHTLDLKCTKKIFSGLQNPDSIKAQVSGSVEGSKFSLPSHASSGTVSGCLKLFLKHYKDTDKGNVAATIEMAVSKGEYGIILLNSISNMLRDGGYGFLYRALFLKKEQGNWNIKAGVQWQDTLFMDAGKPSQTKWHLPGSDHIDGVFWSQKICSLSKECEAQLQGKALDSRDVTYDWEAVSSPTKNVWQGLQIQDPKGPYSNGYEADFWDGKESPISASVSSIAANPIAIFVAGQWQKTDNILNRNKSQLENWFNIFKGDKGEWKHKSA